MYESGATLDCPPKSAEASLDALLGTPQELLDLLPVAVYICHADGRLLRYNRRACEVWQHRAAPGQTTRAFCMTNRLFLPDGTPLPPEAGPVAIALKHGLSTQEREILIERRDRSRIMATVSSAPVRDVCGRIVGAIACLHDTRDATPAGAQRSSRSELEGVFESSVAGLHALTEPRRTEQLLPDNEQRLAATFEHADIGLAETDAAGRLLRVNEAFCAITGHSRAELLAMTFSDLAPEADQAEELALYAEQVSGKRDRYAIEKQQLRGDGTPQWVSVASSAVRGPDGSFLFAVRVLQDISENRLLQERQQMLMGELNHRIKNTLATVQSLAYQTVRKAPDATSFYEKFQGRLMALSKAHSLLTRSQWSGAALRDIIEEQVLPYREGEGRRIILTGTAVALTADQAVVLGMVFHELVTNAIKHGCLSSPSGRVRVNWHIVADSVTHRPWLHLLWQESGGPPAQTPRVHGFGSIFIERSVRDQLSGCTHMDFLPSGLSCRLEIPLSPTMERSA